MTFNEGPCVQAALDELIVRTDDFRTEERWPKYSAAAVELGVLSGLSFKLYTSDRTAGALNLFAFKPSAFDAEDETTGVVLAAHAAAAILASRQGEQLAVGAVDEGPHRPGQGHHHGALRRRRCAGLRDAARLSQDSNTRLIDIAQRVIDTRGEN